MNLDKIFNKLWDLYTSQSPAVQQVYDLFTREGEQVVNDHIAFRTFDDPRINIEVLARHLYLGIIAKSADKIFESTDFYQRKH